MSIVVKFDRISRNHNVPDLVVEASDGDDLSAKVWAYARPFCASREIDVSLNWEEGKGVIVAGFHSAGDFTFEGQ